MIKNNLEIRFIRGLIFFIFYLCGWFSGDFYWVNEWNLGICFWFFFLLFLGVCVEKGGSEVDVYVLLVILVVGIYNIFEMFLFDKEVILDKVLLKIKVVCYGFGVMLVYVGFKGIKEDFGFKVFNVWVFIDNDLDKIIREYF